MKRRKFIQNSVAGTLAMSMPIFPIFPSLDPETRFGVAEASYMLRKYRKLESVKYPQFTNALDMIDHFDSLGFGGAQLTMHSLDSKLAKKIRKRLDELEFFMEGQIRLPKSDSELANFEAQVVETKEMGVTVIRTVCLSGRRYENFDTMEAFQIFRKESLESIQRAEPILRKHKMKLAVENHKDWRADDFLEILKAVDSEWIGVTLDTGNNISLLEDPMEVVEALAPYAFTVHLKDMAVEEYEDGFLMSEVNLGDGFLDIDGMISTIRKHNPEIKFNLEMITRDPLKIPILTDKYWATFDKISAMELAQYIKKIRRHKTMSLPRVSNRSVEEQLALEVENNRTSLVYAKEHYGFS
ncbi:sugar phosphate isomerase/epimerase [Saonia flava]|uniref:Sugar phosphate isomerase/epimerase n=1 Tax=Saonia flava TaxID=523696 RepID=A0A846QVX9_9FLAO|nr:TIM barrel protein [Saonia flava]NJB72148.1 sugar phosphate isomerase/epimerase [Saonia flava]